EKSNTKKKKSSKKSKNDTVRHALPTTDSDGRTLTAEQQEYFKDSKVRDKDGNLLVMYHGSPATDITKFNIESGTYFTANKDYATRYKKGGKVYEVYLNITNPFDTRNAKEKRIFENEFYGQWGNGARLTENGVPDWTDGYDLVEFIQQKGYKYDGVIVDEGADYGFFGDIVPRGLSYIVFDKQNQVKNVTNTAPTADSDIRFALPEVDPVEPTSNAWKPTIDTYEAKARFPSLWDVTADSSEVRNPTQIKSTVSTYRKIYEYLKRNGFDGTILDASSGLGYGTKAGIEEYGFKVDDIEPYPDASYKPKYTDYSTLNKKYDVVISNAVLNVLPQDQRDALVIKMSELLKDGGTMFVNVRGEDVNTLSSNKDNVKIGEREWFVASTGSYQKGFTKNELVAYLRDALGDNYTVEKASFFGGVAVTVTKGTSDSDIRYALSDTDSQYTYAELTAKPDMELTVLQDNAVPKLENGKINKALVKAKALANVRKQKNPLNTEEFVYAHNNDADTDIRVTASKLNHGFDRRIETNAKATVVIGDLIKNAIKVNEVNSLKTGHTDDYVLLSAFSDSKNAYAVSIYVDRVTNEINGFDSVDILYSVNGKEIGTAAPNARDSSQGLPSLTVPTISIAELLEKSNTKFKDIFSKDVYAHFGTEKDTNTKLGATTRYALPEDDTTDRKYTLSAGQVKKVLADYTQDKSYTKAQTESIINTVLSSDVFDFGDTYGDLSKKSRSQVITTLWESLNTSKTDVELQQVASDTAEYIIQNMALESVYTDESNEAYTATIEALKPYLHGLNLQNLKGEIKSKYGDNNAVYALWSAGKEKGIGVDVLQQELAAKGFIVEGDTTADILFNIVDGYSNALQHLQKSAAEMLSDNMSKSELAVLKTEIASSLLAEISKTGNETTYSKLTNKSDIKGLSNLAKALFDENTEAQRKVDSLNEDLSQLTEYTRQLQKDLDTAQENNDKLKKRLTDQKLIAAKERETALKKQLEKQQAALKKQQETQEKAFKKQIDKLTEKYTKEASKWRNRYYESQEYNEQANKVLYNTKKLASAKVGESLNATQHKGYDFGRTIGQLSRISYRGNLNESGTRNIFAGLAEWYTPDNPLLFNSQKDGTTYGTGYYNEEIAFMLKGVAANEKPLTAGQSRLVDKLISQSGAKTMKELYSWYTVKNLGAKYSAETKDLLRTLASDTKFTANELSQINTIVQYFTHFIQTYNKIYRNGQLVDAIPVAKENIQTIHENQSLKTGLGYRFMNNVFNHQKNADGKGIGSYFEWFSDPMSLARWNDRYSDGFYTQTLTSFREAAVGAATTEVQMRAGIESFYDEHKQWYKNLEGRTVEYNGTTLPVMDAMSLYLTLKRKQAQAGLAVSGYTFIGVDGKTTERVDGFAPNLNLNETTPDELNTLAVEQQNILYKELNDTDKEFLDIVEDLFNNQENEYSSKSLKYNTDMKLNGYSNVLDDYYFPIYRAFISKTVDSNFYMSEADRVSNLGFNKNTVSGAKNELYIEPITRILDTHISGVAMYSNMATAIRDYDILFNIDTGENPNKTTSLRTETQNDWRNADKYFKKLLSDMQGISPINGGTGIMGKLRSAYAKSVLGANPKVWVTQFSSVFAATSILDYNSFMKGAAIIASQTSDLDEYCLLAKARNTENTAALAQGILEQTGKVGDVLMKPIGVMDRFVVRWNYAAAQIQVEKEKGYKVGTKENKVEAGKLTEKIILETQQNALATERSAAMRSGSELLKSLTMFTSDAMKVIGRVMDAFGERSVIKAKLSSTTDTKVRAQLEARLKEVNKSLRKSVGALTTSAIFMALVAQAFRSLYNKDKDIEDDEDYALQVLKNIGIDALGNLIGGLPILKDVYSYIAEGYDVSDYSYSTINDLLESVGDLFDMAESLFSGDLTSRDVASNVKTALFTLGKVVGLPISTAYNVFYGLTSRISESTAYKIDDAFSKQSYISDLADAIEKDDMTLASTIMELLLSDRTDASLSDTAMSKLMELYKAGYTSILPKSISSSITYNGETVELTSDQLKAFENTYYDVNEVLEEMISSSTFDKLTEEQQAKAVKLLYDAYYYKALTELTGEDNNTTVGTLSSYMDADTAAMAYAVIATTTSDTDSNGKTISGSKKSNAATALKSLGLSDGEALFMLCYAAGYTITDGMYKNYSATRAKKILLRYILKLNVTQAEKATIAAECGFTVKGNRIITSDI
ncbi:MAG: hypothetical protein LUD19_06480, partial [Clostridia bacterium]|nr:hypothetical protein [Clostridia bacterium]